MGEIKYIDVSRGQPLLQLDSGHGNPTNNWHTHSTHSVGSSDSEPSLKDLLKLLKKRIKLVALITCISTLLGILYCLAATKLYTAVAEVEIKGYAPVLAGASVENLYGADTRRLDYLKTTTAKLKRLIVADQVLKDPDVKERVDKYLDSRRGWSFSSLLSVLSPATDEDESGDKLDGDSNFRHKSSLLNSYLGLIDINPVRETSLVEISATTASPNLSQTLANAHAKAFIEQLREERQNSVKVNLKALQAQAEELKHKLEGTEQELASYAEKNQLVAVSNAEDANVIVKQILSLTDLLTQATARRVKSESLLKEFEAQQSNANSANVDEGAQRSVREALDTAEAEYAAVRQNVTDQFPQAKELRARITSLKSSLNGSNKRQLENLRVLYKSDSAAEKKLIEQIDIAKSQAHKISKSLVQYNLLLKESASVRNLYETVLRQAQETQISGANESSNIIVSDYATNPKNPSAPLTKMVLVTSMLIGVLIGIITVVVLEAFNNRLRTPEDVSNSLSLPILGYIPAFSLGQRPLTFKNKLLKRLSMSKNETQENNDLPPAPSLNEPENIAPQVISNVSDRSLITLTSPKAFVSEALRTIRASILLSSAEQAPQVIMVTSSEKGEGKTTVTANLAVAFAQAGHRTLVIDADLRQSKLSGLFEIPNESSGLADYLAGQKGDHEIIHPTAINNAFICVSGSVPPNPAELLGSKKMKEFIVNCKESYAFILIDCPPILPVADSLMLSRIADAVLFVVRSNISDRGASQEARRRLRNVNAKILGVVLNDLDFRVADHGVGSLNSHSYYSAMQG